MAKKKRTKCKSLSSQLRQAILSSELTRYEIAKTIGVSQALLSRFVCGTVGLSLATADKLGHLLQLELRVKSDE
ncbi:MAG: helix-turn-helix transcriptional regulator [Pirellulales bacterium]